MSLYMYNSLLCFTFKLSNYTVKTRGNAHSAYIIIPPRKQIIGLFLHRARHFISAALPRHERPRPEEARAN